MADLKCDVIIENVEWIKNEPEPFADEIQNITQEKLDVSENDLNEHEPSLSIKKNFSDDYKSENTGSGTSESTVGETLSLTFDPNDLVNYTKIDTGINDFVCNVSGQKYKGSDRIEHSVIHSGEKINVCHICPNTFSRRSALLRHIRTVHIKDKQFSCKICDYKCCRKPHLLRHIKAVHFQEKPFACEFCDYKCSQNASLKTHVTAVHTQEKLFSCSVCDRKFNRRENLRSHVTTVHDQEKRFLCNICSYKFSQKSSLLRHIKTVHLKQQLSCILCEYKCNGRSDDLLRHIQSVHIQDTPFACQICDYKCSKKGNLKRHVTLVHAISAIANSAQKQFNMRFKEDILLQSAVGRPF